MAEDAAASVEASESPETTLKSRRERHRVAFTTLGTELKGLLELPAEAPQADEPRQNRDQKPIVDLANGMPTRRTGH